jgi:hypothetical protein
MRAPSATRRTYGFLALVAFCSLLFGGAICGVGQSNGLERTFPQSKSAVESALRQMNSAISGRLPVLDGFATSPDHPLENYRRGYYQAKFQVSALPSGGSVVRVTVDVTAWFADPSSGNSASGRSGYQLLTSNGRLEADMLDQLSEQLGQSASANSSIPASQETLTPASRQTFPSEQRKSTEQKAPEERASVLPPAEPTKAPASTEPMISAPQPRLPESGGGLTSQLATGLSQNETTSPDSANEGGSPGSVNKVSANDDRALQAELQSLQEILKNQAHPKNLVAVKKSGTPVVASASLNAKTLFLADAHDEFEMLDYNQDWVRVRISGLSRGWIWRNSLEMPDSVPDTDAGSSSMAAATDVFHVAREETAQFPGDWAPLRGKNVKIVSVEKTNENKEVGPQLRLEFVKSLFDQNFALLTQKAEGLAGIVIIFDSADGGMIAAPLTVLQQWKAGALSDAALWHQCFFDPPETFNASTVSPSE